MYTAVVLSDVTITWDHSAVVIPAGTVLSLMAGGALEAAIGTGNLQATAPSRTSAGWPRG